MRARILIVDNHASAVESLKHHLTFEGFLAENARDGQEAELLVSERRFDLVILDSRMTKPRRYSGAICLCMPRFIDINLASAESRSKFQAN
jgi:DNA-binding response OmpR family regulator